MEKKNFKIKGINKSVSKFCWGKVEKGEKVVFLLLSRATKHWNLPLATEFGSSYTFCLLLLFKKQIWMIWGFPFGHNFFF